MYPNQPCNNCQPDCPQVEVPSPPDCLGEPCVEITTGECVRYTGPAIPCIEVTANENLNSIIQKLAAKICDCCDGSGGGELPPSCITPVITAVGTCDEGGTSFTVKVSSDHLATGTTVTVEIKEGLFGASWTPFGTITTTGVALDDFVEGTIALDGSQSAFYIVRARRTCTGLLQSNYSSEVVVITPSCGLPTECLGASNLTATPN